MDKCKFSALFVYTTARDNANDVCSYLVASMLQTKLEPSTVPTDTSFLLSPLKQTETSPPVEW